MNSQSEFVPSSFGFRVMKPKTRHQRLVAKDKVALEQNRINQRVGHEARMHQKNAPESAAGLTACTHNGAGYLSNAERFHTDTCGEEYLVRQEKLRREKEVIQFRKAQAEAREQSRWQKHDAKVSSEEEYWNNLREEGCGAKKNQSLVAYDITSLQYHQTVAGQSAQYDDDMVRYRGKVRTRALVDKGGSRASYNIISGGERNLPQVPDRIEKPEGYMRAYK